MWPSRPNGSFSLQGADVSLEDTLAWQGWVNEKSRQCAPPLPRIDALSRQCGRFRCPLRCRRALLASVTTSASVPLKDWKASLKDFERRAPLVGPGCAGSSPPPAPGNCFSQPCLEAPLPSIQHDRLAKILPSFE